MKNVVIRARCDQALKDRVMKQAERFGLDESDIVRMAVVEYLDAHESKRSLTEIHASQDPSPKSSSSNYPAHREQYSRAEDRPAGAAKKKNAA